MTETIAIRPAARRAARIVVRVRPTGAALGAEVQGVDLRALDDELFAAIHRAWLDHQVLLFRDQALTDDDLVAVQPPLRRARRGARSRRPGSGSSRGIRRSTSSRTSCRTVWRSAASEPGEAVWHTDMSYLPNPPKASVLYALEVPPSGGDTSFCSMYAAWDALPEPLRRRVERRCA